MTSENNVTQRQSSPTAQPVRQQLLCDRAVTPVLWAADPSPSRTLTDHTCTSQRPAVDPALQQAQTSTCDVTVVAVTVARNTSRDQMFWQAALTPGEDGVRFGNQSRSDYSLDCVRTRRHGVQNKDTWRNTDGRSPSGHKPIPHVTC